MLPNEDQFRQMSQSDLAEHIDTAGDLLAFLIEDVLAQRPQCDVDESSLRYYSFGVAYSLCVKASKTFRSILAVGTIGLGDDVLVLSRVLFETFVALGFILDDVIENELSDESLSSEKRAQIYLAHGAVNLAKEARQFDAAHPNILTKAELSGFTGNLQRATELVGEPWIERLGKYSKTYSGLNLKDLCEKLKEPYWSWREGLYGLQSMAAHATDGVGHLAFCESESGFVPKFQSPPDEIRRQIAINGLIVCEMLALFIESFGYDEDVTDRLDELRRRFQDLYAEG